MNLLDFGRCRAVSQIRSYLQRKIDDLFMEAKTKLAAHLLIPKGRIVSSAAPTSKRSKAHETHHFSTHKRKVYKS